MKPEDTFVRADAPPQGRRALPASLGAVPFPPSPHTLGFTVYDKTELDFTSAWQVRGRQCPSATRDTPLVAQRQHEEAEAAAERASESAALEESFERLVHVLDTIEQSGDGRVSAKEAEKPCSSVGG